MISSGVNWQILISLKKTAILFMAVLMIIMPVRAQVEKYSLLPDETTLPVNGKIPITLYELRPHQAPVPITNIMVKPSWSVNGVNFPAENAAYGKLTVSLGLFKVTYTAPSKVPDRNPVAVAVSFYDDSSHQQITLVCNISIYTEMNSFKLNGGDGLFRSWGVKMEAEEDQRAKLNGMNRQEAMKLAQQYMNPQQMAQYQKAMNEHGAQAGGDTSNMKAIYYPAENKFLITQIWPGTAKDLQHAASITIILNRPDTGSFSFALDDHRSPQPGVIVSLPRYPDIMHPAALVSEDSYGGNDPPFSLQGNIFISRCDAPGGRVKGIYLGWLMGADPQTGRKKIYARIGGQFNCLRMQDK